MCLSGFSHLRLIEIILINLKSIIAVTNHPILGISEKGSKIKLKNKAIYSEKRPYYFSHKKLLKNYKDCSRSSKYPGI